MGADDSATQGAVLREDASLISGWLIKILQMRAAISKTYIFHGKLMLLS